jgi:Spy/CpxP family protein refolding chaperone
MKSNVTVRWFLAGSLFLTPLAANAGDPPAPQPPAMDSARMEKHHQKMWAELKLTPDQKSKFQALHKQTRETMKPFFEKMKGIMEKSKAELLKPQPSLKTLDGYAAEMGDLHKQMAQKRVEQLLQIKAILTPEQFTKLLSRDFMGPPEGFGPGKGMGKGRPHHDKDSDGPDGD